MPSENRTNSPAEISSAVVPQGFVAVPVALTELSARLRICVLLRTDSTPAKLVMLRETVDGHALLGCIIDSANNVHRWLEVWTQNPGRYTAMPAVVLETLSNAVLDQRWERAVAAMQCVDSTAVVRTGWEVDAPLPTWIDPVARLPFQPSQDGHHWTLCRDEAVLSEAELPSYGSSLHRYLYLVNLGPLSPLVPITPAAPQGLRTQPLNTLLGNRTDLVPLNVGGLMFFRTFEAMSLEVLFDLLSGRKDAIAADDRLPINLKLRPDALQDPVGQDGWVFVGQHGRWGRLLETFHLKLRALAGAVSAARAAIGQSNQPLLNITGDSYRVSMDEPAPGLPRLWTARILLADGGDAVAVPIPGSDANYYIPRPRSGSPIYRPSRTGNDARGRGSVRIRKTLPPMADGIVVEGTLATHERIDMSASDLIWLRMSFDDGSADLYARVEAEAGMAAGEWRFRSIGQQLDPVYEARLRANEGRPTPAEFEVLPVFSSPCDLYSLAVLAVRALLVNATVSLPVALDEMLSLARQVANKHDNSGPLHLRVRSVFESDKRWLDSLGPQRLVWEDLPPEQALDMIPLELWMNALAMIVAMFPGVGPDSACADLGSAPQGALHRVFDRAVADLQNLLVRTRSLIVIDWRYNREIHSVIRGFSAGLVPPPVKGIQPPPPPPSARKAEFSNVRLK